MKKILPILISFIMVFAVCITPTSAASNINNYDAIISLSASDLSEIGKVKITAYMDVNTSVDIACMQFELFWDNEIRYEENGIIQTVYPCFSYKDGADDFKLNPLWELDEVSATQGGSLKIFIGEDFSPNVTVKGTVELFSVQLTTNQNLPDGSYNFNLRCQAIFYINDENPLNLDFPDVILASDSAEAKTFIGERLEFFNKEWSLPIYRENSDYYPIYLNKKVENIIVFDDSIVEIVEYEYDEDMGYTTVLLKGKKEGKTSIYANSAIREDDASCSVEVEKGSPMFINVQNISEIKTEYVLGESLDLSGLKLKLIYSDNGYEIIDEGYGIWEDYDFSTPGEKNIRVYYESKNMYAYLPVKVYDLPQIETGDYSLLGDVIYNISQNTSEESFLSQVTLSDDEVFSAVVNKSSVNYSGENLGTGMTCDILLGGRVVKSYEIAVSGDINGDGSSNIIDLQRLKKAVAGMSGTEPLSDAQRIALHGNTSKQDAADLVRLQKNLIS
ncbi:MAG: bacterial Ig-like domain-containing protein [Clostridia bacterium]|nr:bacterial Ig-like domain-containing protein [Clostridia bacterium]